MRSTACRERRAIGRAIARRLGLKRGTPREDLLSSSRFHRIIRRGCAYGNAIGRECAAQQKGSRIRTGPYFIALNANIAGQCEFMQNSWIVNSKFNGLDGESDPLLGNRHVSLVGQRTDKFSLPQARGSPDRWAPLVRYRASGRVLLAPRPAGLAFSGAPKCERLSSTRTNQCESHCGTTIDFKDKVAGVP